ncbi:MAG: aminoglycoside phosphotransferase family protein [Firmicutes bacterium]|nr:aminoglycoside phosphotransferase family protein [Bacillota bacterium]
METITYIAQQFALPGLIQSIEPYGEGHINDTYLVKLRSGSQAFMLQRINDKVFKDVPVLMSNIDKVIAHINAYFNAHHLPENAQFLKLVHTKTKHAYYQGKLGYFRMYEFIPDSVTYTAAPRLKHLEAAGRAIGEFQHMLADFDATQLSETIPLFHDTPNRVEALIKAIATAQPQRFEKARGIITLALERQPYASKVTEAIARGEVPIRVTHNDTKFNNILFKANSSDAICLVDLDTVMPGSALYDFGDAVRSACTTSAEDETDLDSVKFDLRKFKALTRGYLSVMKQELKPKEIELLAFSPILLTYEVAVRFLTDYLLEDIYFKIDYPEHNLVRAENQFQLMKSMESKLPFMQKTIDDLLK